MKCSGFGGDDSSGSSGAVAGLANSFSRSTPPSTADGRVAESALAAIARPCARSPNELGTPAITGVCDGRGVNAAGVGVGAGVVVSGDAAACGVTACGDD